MDQQLFHFAFSFFLKEILSLRDPVTAQWVKDLELPQLWCRLQLHSDLVPGPGFPYAMDAAKKKKKKRKEKEILSLKYVCDRTYVFRRLYIRMLIAMPG